MPLYLKYTLSLCFHFLLNSFVLIDKTTDYSKLDIIFVFQNRQMCHVIETAAVLTKSIEELQEW
jgi:hypothetical protein